MTRIVKSLALLLVLVMCMGVFTACGGNTDPTDGTKPSETDPSTAPTEGKVELDPVGIIKEISDTFIRLDLCADNVQGLPYTKLDVDALEGTGKDDYVYVNSGAQYAYYADGELTTLKSTDLAIGQIVVVTKDSKDVQLIVIMNYNADSGDTDVTDPTGSADVTEPTGDNGAES